MKGDNSTTNKHGSSMEAAVVGALVGSVVTAAFGIAAYWIQSTRRQKKSTSLSNPSSSNHQQQQEEKNRSLQQLHKEIPDEIRSEQLSRNTLFFGSEGMSNITSSTVAVIGLGGVGSHIAHMLARSGVQYLRLIDFDQISLSSLNRHACATLEDVGLAKAIVLSSYLRKICPDERHLVLDPRVVMFTGKRELDGDLLDEPNPYSSSSSDHHRRRRWDIIIDAIDDVPTKAALLAHCIQNDIRVISCMGAACKSDVTRLHISDLRSASRDPLASKLRQLLKKHLLLSSSSSSTTSTTNTTNNNTNNSKNFNEQQTQQQQQQQQQQDTSLSLWQSRLENPDRVAVIYSSEKTVAKLADFTDEQRRDGVHNYGAMDGMRIRILPVLGTMPAIMGQACAALALSELGGKPFSPVAGERVGRNVRHRMYQHLKRREYKIRETVEAVAATKNSSTTTTGSTTEENNINEDTNTINSSNNNDMILHGTWIGDIRIDSDDVEYLLSEIWRNRCAISGDRLGTVLELVRWDMSRPSDCTNLVVMGAKALSQFDAYALKQKQQQKQNGKEVVGWGDGRLCFDENIRSRIEARLSTCRIDFNA